MTDKNIPEYLKDDTQWYIKDDDNQIKRVSNDEAMAKFMEWYVAMVTNGDDLDDR